MSSTANQPQIDITQDGNRLIARFQQCDSLNEFNAERVGQLLSGLALDHADKNVVLDLNGIQYLTSTILGHLMALHKKLRTTGGKLSLENLRPAVKDVFHATLLDQVLDIRADDPPRN